MDKYKTNTIVYIYTLITIMLLGCEARDESSYSVLEDMPIIDQEFSNADQDPSPADTAYAVDYTVNDIEESIDHSAPVDLDQEIALMEPTDSDITADAEVGDQSIGMTFDMTVVDHVVDAELPVNNIESCVRMNDYDLTESGPYEVEQSESAVVKVYQPINRPESCKMPILHFSNGTGAVCSFYQPLLSHIASYGYLALCYESPQTGSGTPCMTAIESALSLYGDDVYHDRFVSSGHSQGGGAGHVCQYLLEERFPEAQVISATVQPAHGMNRISYRNEYPQIQGPVFLMSGSLDTVVGDPWIFTGYQLFTSEKYWYVAREATHFNFHNWAKTSILSFTQWKLFEDEQAHQYFTNLLQDTQLWGSR